MSCNPIVNFRHISSLFGYAHEFMSRGFDMFNDSGSVLLAWEVVTFVNHLVVVFSARC